MEWHACVLATAARRDSQMPLLVGPNASCAVTRTLFGSIVEGRPELRTTAEAMALHGSRYGGIDAPGAPAR